MLVPGNRFEYLEAQRRAMTRSMDGELDAEQLPPRRARRAGPAHHGAAPAPGRSTRASCCARSRSACPMPALPRADVRRACSTSSPTGGYALQAPMTASSGWYQEPDGTWRVSHPRFIAQHRHQRRHHRRPAPMLDVRFRNGRKLGTVEEGVRRDARRPATRFFFAGHQRWRSSASTRADLIVRATHQVGAHPDLYGRHAHGDDRPISPTGVRAFLPRPQRMAPLSRRRARMAGGAGLSLGAARAGPAARRDLPARRPHYMVVYSFEGWNAHQSLGMLLTRRMEERGLKPIGFVANDYALGVYGLEPVADPRPLFSPDILEHEFVDWVQESRAAQARLPRGGGDRRAGRAPASRQAQDRPAGELLDRPDLRRAAPLRARPSAAQRRLGRCARADDRCRPPRATCSTARPSTMRPCRRSTRVSPMAVPVLIMIGRETPAAGHGRRRPADGGGSLAAEAMRLE